MPQQKRPLSDIFNEPQQRGLDDIFSDTPAAPAAQDTTQTPQVTPQSTDQTTVEDISWAEAVGGFRPDRLAKSFGKNAWNVITGVPGLPKVVYELGKEFSRAPDIGYITPEMSQELERLGMPLEATTGGDITAESHPLLFAIAQDYKERFGSTAGLKKALRDDPFSVLVEVLPIISKLGKAGKLGKFAQRHQKWIQYANPEELAGTILEALPNQRPGAGYNPDVASTYGRDAQRQRLQTTRPVGDIAEDVLGPGQGGAEGDVPAMVLSDSGDVQIREGIQMHAGGDIETATRERFDTSKAGIEEYQRQMVTTEGISEGYSPFDPVSAGDQVIENFRETQIGNRSGINQLYDEIEAVTTQDGVSALDLAVPELTTTLPLRDRAGDLIGERTVELGYDGYFDNTMGAMLDLSRADSKLLSNKDYDKVKNILQEAIDTAQQGGWTLRDFDKLRTNFRQNLNLAIQNGEVTRTGSGTIASKMYSALTEDLYNLLEHVTTLDENIPNDFPQKVRAAKDAYKAIIDLENTKVGKFLMRNQDNPRRIIDSILKGDLIKNTEDMGTLRQLIGDQGMRDLQPALLSRIFDNALRQDVWSATGLRSEIAKVNSANKNKLRDLFGDTQAQVLSELAEFSARFAREARVKTNSPTGFINRVVGNNTFGSIVVRLGEIAGTLYYSGLDPKMIAAYGSAAVFVNYFGSKVVDRWMNSANGRRTMLEGGLRFGDTVVTAQQLREVIRKTQIATRTGVHVQQAAERPARRGTAMEQLRGSRLGGYRYDAQ